MTVYTAFGNYARGTKKIQFSGTFTIDSRNIEFTLSENETDDYHGRGRVLNIKGADILKGLRKEIGLKDMSRIFFEDGLHT